MPSPHSILIARWLLVPGTLMWCQLMLDNPGERIIRAWARAFLQQSVRSMGTAKHGGTGGHVEPTLI